MYEELKQIIVEIAKIMDEKNLVNAHEGNLADSDYTFATDDVSVTAYPQSGELQLLCDTAAQGSSILHRFSYQASVIVQTTEPSISGSIFWRKSVASAVPQFANNLFTVQASILIPPPPGQFGGTFQKVADGTVIYPPAPAASGFLPDGLFVQYVIENPPVNTDLYIICSPVDGAFQPAGSLAGTLQCAVLENPSANRLVTITGVAVPDADELNGTDDPNEPLIHGDIFIRTDYRLKDSDRWQGIVNGNTALLAAT
jgi:hypothetical protein